MMDPQSDRFWSELVRLCEQHPVLAEKSRHLESCTIALEIGEARRFIEFHRGRLSLAQPLHGYRFRVSGSTETWGRVLKGELHYMQALSPLVRLLRLDGDFLMANWAGRAMCEMLAISARELKGNNRG